MGFSFKMKFSIKYIIIVSCFLFSCETKENALPENLIPKKEMVVIISEIELTQALIKLKFSNQDSINAHLMYDEVYNSFNISKEQFNQSLSFYCKDPRVAEDIYLEAIERLSEKQVEKH